MTVWYGARKAWFLMKYTQGKYPIIKKTTLAKEVYDFTIYCPKIAKAAEMGQFVNIYAESFSLRRPISICGIDKEYGTIRLVFEVRGKGTKEISSLNEGDTIDILAPLGRGFRIKDYKKAILVGGGIGTPPLLPLAQYFGENCTAISGFRTASAVILQEDFKSSGAKTILCTDDGTIGRKGFVTEALRKEIKNQKPDIIYSCGPAVMMKGVVDIAGEFGIQSQISLEERMACGIGACLVCACRTVRNGEEFYAHVCQDGPVFESKDVIF